jgi:hypothetical protein
LVAGSTTIWLTTSPAARCSSVQST